MPAPDFGWVANPDIITEAILALVKVVGAAFTLMVSSLVGVLLYIWNEHKKTMTRMSEDFKGEISRVAQSLETISNTLFDRQRDLEIRMGEQETRCDERHTMHRRATDK